MKDYSDIIHMERPVPLRPKMDLGNRAKIFSSFDALRGFDLALLTKQVEQELKIRITLMDDAQELLDRKLHMIQPGTKVTKDEHLPDWAREKLTELQEQIQADVPQMT